MFDTLLKKRIALSVCYVIIAAIIDASFFISIDQTIPQYILMDLCIIGIIGVIAFIIPSPQIQTILLLNLLFAQTLISYFNQMAYTIFADFISISMYYLAGHAVEAIHSSFFTFGYLKILLAIIAATLIIFKVIDKKKPVNNNNLFIKPLAYSLGFILLISGCYNLNYYLLPAYSENDNSYKLDNPKYAYDTLINKSLAIKTFGLLTYYFREANLLLFNNEQIDYQETKDYFLNAPFNKPNDYTGTNKGDNVILFLMESFEWFTIDPELTPTLYKLANEGMAYRQYYSKNKTNHSETISVTGSFPGNEGLLLDKNSINRYSADSFFFSLPNMLKKDGVEVASFFHGNKAKFYSRGDMMPKYGFDNALFLRDIAASEEKKEAEFNDWTKDSDTIKANIQHIAPNDGKRFFTLYTTITTHGVYEENLRLKPYYDKLDKLRPTLKQDNPHLYYYQAAVMDLDEGFRYLLEYLEENQLLDNTLLVLYSDHHAFYHNLTYKVKHIDTSEYANIEAHRVPMIMYSPKLGARVNTDFTTSYNIVPTILDLLGIQYQTNFYPGVSVFSDQIKDNLFISQTGGIFDKQIFSPDGSSFFSTTNESLTPEQIEDFRNRVSRLYYQRQQIDKIYQFDIFNPQSTQ